MFIIQYALEISYQIFIKHYYSFMCLTGVIFYERIMILYPKDLAVTVPSQENKQDHHSAFLSPLPPSLLPFLPSCFPPFQPSFLLSPNLSPFFPFIFLLHEMPRAQA